MIEIIHSFIHSPTYYFCLSVKHSPYFL